MKLLALCLVTVVASVAAAFLALGQTNSRAVAAPPTPQHLTMEVWPGDRIVGQNLVAQPGRVVLTILNYAHHAHTFSVPSLGVERVVLPGSSAGPTVTTVKFTASSGVFEWICRLPCKHSMTGDMYVVSNPPNLNGPLWAHA